MKTQAFTLASILLISTATGFAAEGPAGRLDALTMTRDRVASAARDTKGIPRAALDLEGARLNRLIAELEAGQSVDPMEIDDELRRANRLHR